MSDDEQRRKVEKPCLSCDDAAALAEQLFDVRVIPSSVRMLNSYDDCNFRLKGLYPNQSEPSTFTLKVHNGVDTENVPFLEAQNAVLEHLCAGGVVCPRPYLATNGTALAFAQLPIDPEHAEPGSKQTRRHAVRLLAWVDGELMNSVEIITRPLLVNVGAFTGRMCAVLGGFDHAGAHRVHLWDLQRAPLVGDYVDMVDEPEVRDVLREVLREFDASVVPILASLPNAVIQGDLNDANILVDAGSETVSGVIDLGDMIWSKSVFELAICMAYSMLRPPAGMTEAETAAAVLEGFLSTSTLNDVEISLLRVLVAMRLVQSIAMGAYALSKQPTNEYLKLHSVPARRGLRNFWRTDRKVVEKAMLDAKQRAGR